MFLDGQVFRFLSVVAYLDDIYAVCKPERVRKVFDLIEQHFTARAGIRVHLGKCIKV